jgi:hypothetical protein
VPKSAATTTLLKIDWASCDRLTWCWVFHLRTINGTSDSPKSRKNVTTLRRFSAPLNVFPTKQ